MAKIKYKIKISPMGSEDLDEIYSYIAEELFNENAADNLMNKIESRNK